MVYINVGEEMLGGAPGMNLAVFWGIFGVSLVLFCVVERVLNAFMFLFMGEDKDQALRAGLVMGSALNVGGSLVGSLVSLAARSVSLVGWVLVLYLVFYCLSAVWYVMYEQHPEVVFYAVEFYNSRFGPFLHGFFFVPLDLFNVVLKGVLPLYNGIVWIVRGLLFKGLLPLVWDEAGLLVDLGVSLLGLGKGLSLSLVGFVQSLGCDGLTCIDRPAALDLVTPMGSVRDLAVVSSRMGGALCSSLAVPIDLALYPLVDVRLARGLHSLVNGLLHLVLHVPRAAAKRCNAYGKTGAHVDVLMCTPDVQPVFDHTVSGVRDIGIAVDNWIGVGAAMARRSLTGLPEDCSRETVAPDRFRGGLLNGLQTVVGLTDWLMAASNGSLAYFWGQVTVDVAPRSWPEPVDVRMGLAAVSFDEAAEVEVSGVTQGQRPATRQTTSVFGCRCLDTTKGLVVRCSVLPMTGLVSGSSHSFDVKFQDSTWSGLMTCAQVEVSVRSVRWPVRRYEGKTVPFAGETLDLPGTDCMSRGSCESVDATIWLVPRCDLLRPEQCSDAAVGTSCFPFCMAARISGSRNANPVFVNAEAWRSGRQLLMRDCGLNSTGASASYALSVGKNRVSTSAYGDTTLAGASGGDAIFVSGAGDGAGCLAGSSLVSWAPLNGSTGLDSRSVGAYLRRRGQPFAIAGDAMLMEFAQPDGASTVEVDRLTGNQRDVYSLVAGWAGLPTAPKFLVPLESLASDERGRVVVPIDLVATRVPSTSSRNYVFYAVSPDLRIFQAYLDYCRDPSKLPQASYMMASSYSALRVYRVRAYCQETCEAGDLTAQFTFDGFSDGKFNAQTFPQDCRRVYNASIDALEYVNEQNLAVTVQVADKSYDPLVRSGTNSTYVTYWLNPQTMRAKTGGMWSAEVPTSLTTGLCAVGDGVPHLGSLGAELGVAGLHLMHRISGAVLYAPGMVSFWRGGSRCPLVSRGHSVLESCGRSVFDLDDFFDSLDAAAAVFWGIPAWVVEQLEQGKVVSYSPVSDLLRGFGEFGKGTVGITEIQNGVLSLLNTPLPEQLVGVYAFVRQPGALAGTAKVVGSASSMARFSSRFFSVVGIGIAETLAVKGSIELGELWRDTMNTLYDQRPFFKTTVTDRGASACVGLKLMMGGDNPVGKLLYHNCLSAVMFLDGTMDVVLHAFVDAPMVKCVCKDSEGQKVGSFAREYCVGKGPKTMQPVLYGMISASERSVTGDALLCPAVIAYTRKSLEGTLRPYFESVFSALDALGDSVDYMLSGFDADASQCSNFRVDPQVVVIMPEPVDYFRGCGGTTYCKTKCAGEWDAFDAERAKYSLASLSGSRELERTVDSMFFPSVVPDMIAPGKVVAMVRPDFCGLWVCRSEEDECLAVAALTGAQLDVLFYCVPTSPSAVTYKSEQALAWGAEVGSGWSQVSFLANDGSSLVVLVDARQVWLLRRGLGAKVVMDVAQILSLPLTGSYPMGLVSFLPVRQRLVVSVAVRTGSDGKFHRDVGTVWFSPLDVVDVYSNRDDLFPVVVSSPVFKDLWSGYAVSEFAGGLPDETVALFWPLTAEASLRRVRFSWTNQTVSAFVELYQTSQSLLARATMMPRRLVLSKTMRDDLQAGQYVAFATTGDVYDWLRQLRLSRSGVSMSSASLSNAQPVRATIGVSTGCDGLDCRGCPNLALRSLCSAYQSCSVFKCVGTPVNLKRPLCGVGQVLKSLGNVGITNVQGAWIMFVDIFMILLQLKTVKNLPGVDVSFPEDSFMGSVCAAKDVSAEFFSILTATVNSALQRVQTTTGVFSHFTNVDSSVNTMISLSMAAITGFLHQIALAPVYVLAVGRKIMLCRVSGFLAVFNTRSKVRIDIQSALTESTDAISGQCLTTGAEVNAQQTGDAGAVRDMSSHMAELLAGAGQRAVMARLEPYMHMLDGLVTYLIGVVTKFADVLQATDLQHCMLPDVTLKQTVRCACGDKPAAIISARAGEGLDDFAYWCTGTLSLVDADNRVQVVWNPYSYRELQARVGKRLDDYVDAASESLNVVAPNEAVFEDQGVSVLAVLNRCRQNYINKQWDPAAFVRYDGDMLQREIRGGVQVVKGVPEDGVGQCLLDSLRSGVGNGACLDSFLRNRGYNSLYWGYRLVNETVPSNEVDACLVFSGPASNQAVSDERRRPFQNCLGGYENQSTCDLSGFVWSPASSNEVPVAARHVVRSGDGGFLKDAIENRMTSASAMVMKRLEALRNFSGDNLQAVLFSAEGDVIHQLMDCVFLGPYARMDYWPTPRCDESERDDCLVGPYWSRDDARGKSRSIDVDSCDVSGTLPFTCGSPTRRAMVKDFVKQYLQVDAGGAGVVTELIRQWLAKQERIWWDPYTFYCKNCSGCCDGYMPRALSDVEFNISTRGVMNDLKSRLKIFYRASMASSEPWISELEASEFAKYDWSASGGVNQIQTHALYHPSMPTQRYDKAEAASPTTSPGGPSLWRVCHSALKQVFFTMPVGDGGNLTGTQPVFSGGGPEVISAYVKGVMATAKEYSPLFRHYHPRHHPSQSRMCQGSAGVDPGRARGSVGFSNYSLRGVTLVDGGSLGAIPALGYDGGVLGVAWNATYLGLSDHLGFLDREGTEAWLSGAVNITTSAENLLRYGPGGLKIGNLPGVKPDLGLAAGYAGGLDSVMRDGFVESSRQTKLESAVLYGCTDYAKNTSDLLREFVDGLFPMAQGVRESGVGSYCLRFALELALLYAMDMAPDLDVAELTLQKELVVTWRRRCGTQVQLVGMCNALDIYHYQGLQTSSCLMSWNLVVDSTVEMYLTPECLVKIGDVFYDPCQCKPDWCEPRDTTQVIRRQDLENTTCAMRFDPRKVVQATELGWWGEDETDPSAAAWNAWLEDPVNMLDLSGLKSGLWGDGQSVGNVPSGGHWSAVEGFMNQSAAYCDMVADYWPEDAVFPVGYHVTTPCHKDDAGYRSFDNVFALEQDSAGNPRFAYLEDQTRDADMVDSHYGAGGLCRSTTFGFDMFETNTMRVCTRVSDAEDVDVHVPRGQFSGNQLGLARCSGSSSELPWAGEAYYDYYDSVFFNVGTVPNMPSASATTYPESADRYMFMGPQADMEASGWGDSCYDFVIPNCSQGKWQCPTGFVCRPPGVCQHPSVQCVRHSDCAGGKMCNGLGICETPMVSFENDLGEDVSFRAHTTECAGESFSMLGASYWGYVPDVLEAHGMCSYRHWQEYLYTIGLPSCCAAGASTCQLQAATCPLVRFSKDQSVNKWWNTSDSTPSRLKMIPTTCDRDYERFRYLGKEMASCVPSQDGASIIKPDLSYQKFFERELMWKVYDAPTRSVPLLLMPLRSKPSDGFTGLGSINNIMSCMSIRQCYVDTFTRNGFASMDATSSVLKANRTLVSGVQYKPDDQFRCGVVGYYDSTKKKCVVDVKLFPVYYVLCVETPQVGLGMCQSSLSQVSLSAMCDRIGYGGEYEPDYNTIQDVVVPGLNDFLYAFKQPTTLTEHINLVQCVEYVYGVMSKSPFQSKGVYVAFAFTLFEVPFGWFYQCMIGSGIRVSQSFDQKIYPCSAYSNKVTLQLAGTAGLSARFVTNLQSYVFGVRGGYRSASFEAERLRQVSVIKAAWQAAVEDVRSLLFGKTGSQDLTFARCYSELRWALPNSNQYRRKMIESFVTKVCANSLLRTYVDAYRTTTGRTNVTVENVINELVVLGGSLVNQGMILAEQKLLGGLISKFGLDWLSAQTAMSKIDGGSVPVKLSYGLPASNSSEFQLARQNWKRLSNVLPNSVDDKSVELPRNCPSGMVNVFNDPGEDTNIQNGFSNMVQVCSVYAQGKFSCFYPDLSLGSTIRLRGNLSDVEGQFDTYANALYDAVKLRYDERMRANAFAGAVGPILMSALQFFEDEATLGFGVNFQFNLKGVADYMSNINPDVQKPVMCVAGNQEVNFNNCTDQNFKSLKSHAYSKFRSSGGAVVPDQNQLDWKVSRSMMTSGAIFSFASTKRDLSKKFLDRMFDEDTVCGSTSTLSNRDKLCFFEGNSSYKNRSVIAPWLGGGWNPFDKCDVRQLDLQSGNAEVIDSLCYFDQYCPKTLGQSKVGNPYYQNMPNYDCSSRDNERTSNINVNSRFMYNLCRHRLKEDSVCNHTQGMLGGADGSPAEDFDVNGDLFNLHDFSEFPYGNDAFFGSVVLAGGASDYGFVNFKESHIGGSRLGLRLGSDGVMYVSKLPLKSIKENTRISDWDGLETKDWIPGYYTALGEDDLEYRRAVGDGQSVSGQTAWDCPLRRRAYYTGGVKNFKPMLPSARRSRMLFGELTGGTYVHPTQRRADGSARLGMYKSTNGFCFCPVVEEVWPGMCNVDILVGSGHNCSLQNTIQALAGNRWGFSHVFRPKNRQNEFKTCNVQVDWPFVGGELRDNSKIDFGDVDPSVWGEASDAEARRCHVLDRAPDFAYAYVSRREFRRSGFTTLERGVCHTGRVQKRFQSQQRCVRKSKSDDFASLSCADNSGGSVERPRSKNPLESAALARIYRRRCDKCTRPPGFATRGGREIPAETSFGLHYRHGVERVLSQDLRAALCKNENQCGLILNGSAWKKGVFLKTLLDNPERLFRNKSMMSSVDLSGAYETKSGARPDDSALWARKWVYCPTKAALKTGKDCNGSISKSTWRSDKVGACHAVISDSLKGKPDPFAATEICNIDSRLTDLCVAIREAQSLIVSANCIASGDDKCALQEYVYNPSTWESSNQAFVHQTVKEYYMRTDGCTSESDCICPVDDIGAQLRMKNTYTLKDCSAVPVMTLRGVLIGVRSLIYPICKILSILLDIVFNLFLMISSDARDAATSRIVLDWAQLKQESSVVVDKVSDMIFDVIFSVGSLGPYLKDGVQSACGVINTAYKYAADVWCGLVVEQLPLFLAALRSIGGWIEVGFSVVNDVFNTILDDTLPDAMMDLYQSGYREYFQSARYRAKQAEYEDRKEASLVNAKEGKKSSRKDLVPVDNKFLKNLGDAREQRMQRTTFASASKLASALGGLGILGGVVDLAITGKQIYDQVQQAQEIKAMLEKFPTSLTLFNYDDFYLAIDGLVEYLNADFTCYSMRSKVAPLQCTWLNFTQPSADDVNVMAPRPSVCWAEAQQRQVGVSNLYACTATSTCCSDPLNCDDTPDGAKLCSECPLPTVAGVRTYGCNTMLQRCQCGVETFEVSRCAAQRDCGPAASCSLMTSLDDVSFGSLKSCTSCATSPVCLMGSSQQFGQCSCLTGANLKVDLCNAGVGVRVNPGMSKLCGFARDTGGYYAWNELSLVSCSNALMPFCAEVLSETGSVIYMSVSTRLRSGQVTYGSRRLLSVEGEGDVFVSLPSALLPEDPADDVTPEVVHKSITELEWNHTAVPCSSLAVAYRRGDHLGPVDEATLHSCVYWRSVARQLIREHDLKTLWEHDTFLLSASDLSAVLGQRGVLLELLRKPYALLHAVLYSQWVKPVRAMLVASHDANVSTVVRNWTSRLAREARRYRRRLGKDATVQEWVLNGTRGRRLLGLWEDTQARLISMPYYSLVRETLSDLTVMDVVNTSAAQAFGTDAFSVKHVDSDGLCKAWDVTSEYVGQTFVVSRRYYDNLLWVNAPVSIRRRFKDVLPNGYSPNASMSASVSRNAIFDGVMSLFGWTVQDLVSFFTSPCPKDDCTAYNRWTASYLVESAVFCDLNSVMLCSNHRNDMVTSAIVMLLCYVVLSYILSYMGLPGVSTIIFLALPVIILWYSIGVSPRCFPMIPTCLLDDLLASLKSVFPSRVSLPSFLVANETKLRSCSELDFASWEDPLAFAWCDMGFCDNATDFSVWDVSHWRFSEMSRRASGKNVEAYRVCATVMATNSVPALIAASVGIGLGAALVISLVSLLGPVVSLLWQIIVFDHSS